VVPSREVRMAWSDGATARPWRGTVFVDGSVDNGGGDESDVMDQYCNNTNDRTTTDTFSHHMRTACAHRPSHSTVAILGHASRDASIRSSIQQLFFFACVCVPTFLFRPTYFFGRT
jgi:hypothetical protein